MLKTLRKLKHIWFVLYNWNFNIGLHIHCYPFNWRFGKETYPSYKIRDIGPFCYYRERR